MEKIAESIEEILQAYLDGKFIICDHVSFSRKDSLFPIVLLDAVKKGKWSIKDSTININGFEVPEPFRGNMKYKDQYWFPSLESESAEWHTWNNDITDIRILKNGIIHLTKEAAEIHLQALLSFTKQEDES